MDGLVKVKSKSGLPKDVEFEFGGNSIYPAWASIEMRPDEPIMVTMGVFVGGADIEGVPVWYAQDPETREMKEVKAIEFADGTAFRGNSGRGASGYARMA